MKDIVFVYCYSY